MLVSGLETTPPKYVTLDVRPQGFAICTLCRPPVNAMNLDFWNHLQDALDAAEATPHVHGVVLVSGLDRNVFTAGNDLMELHARYSSRERYQQFWETVNICLSRLYRSPLVTVAAVRGACPAGGCALSLCCDYRMITRDTKIGLNEVQLGIPVPKYWALLMARAVGATVSERLLFSGEMIDAEAAKKVGMVNVVVERHQELLPMAESTMAELLRVDVAARAVTKHHLRNEFSRDWEAYCVEEASHGWELLAKPETMAQMDKKMQQLGGGGMSASRSRL